MTQAPYLPPQQSPLQPYLTVEAADAYILFLQRAFGACLGECIRRPDGSVAHAELQLSGCSLMLSEAMEGQPARSCVFYLYVPDADAAHAQALAAGAESIMAPGLRPYGNLEGAVKDPSGTTWWLATMRELLSEEEIQRRLFPVQA